MNEWTRMCPSLGLSISAAPVVPALHSHLEGQAVICVPQIVKLLILS
jgi:hypothetical protein